ncbi:MAG TPA: response regulator, partial [Acidobacteriota bacterium]|nr:response regulator [Acidobacteriota bacterium]
VATAENGLEAARWFDDPTFARELRLVVTDVMMPRLGGREIVDLVRRRFPHVRVLVMSGLGTGAPDTEQLGDEFLLKPFRHDDLLRKLHALLHRGAS